MFDFRGGLPAPPGVDFYVAFVRFRFPGLSLDHRKRRDMDRSLTVWTATFSSTDFFADFQRFIAMRAGDFGSTFSRLPKKEGMYTIRFYVMSQIGCGRIPDSKKESLTPSSHITTPEISVHVRLIYQRRPG